jgi:hypothetical protein
MLVDKLYAADLWRDDTWRNLVNYFENYQECKEKELKSVILDYEVKASWWANWISCKYGHSLAGKYFAWKVCRKFKRWKRWGIKL